jgi:hypothetical protein
MEAQYLLHFINQERFMRNTKYITGVLDTKMEAKGQKTR